MLGDGKDWRNETHFDLNLGFAWVDLLFLAPLFVTGSLGYTYFWEFFLYSGAVALAYSALRIGGADS